MNAPVVVRNVYCIDPEDRVVPWQCAACRKCWLFVASKKNLKNGRCPWGGPYQKPQTGDANG